MMCVLFSLVSPIIPTFADGYYFKRDNEKALFIGSTALHGSEAEVRKRDLPLKSITLNLGNVHIYENNIERTKSLLEGNENVKFDLNV